MEKLHLTNAFFYMDKSNLELSLKKIILQFHFCKVKYHLKYNAPLQKIAKFHPAETVRFHNIFTPGN